MASSGGHSETPQDLESLVHEVLRDGFAVNLGVSDASGPWVAPVVYVLDDAFDSGGLMKKREAHAERHICVQRSAELRLQTRVNTQPVRHDTDGWVHRQAEPREVDRAKADVMELGARPIDIQERQRPPRLRADH